MNPGIGESRQAVQIVRGASRELASEWAAVFHEAFGPMLTFWPALPRDRGRALEAIAHAVDPASVYLALDGMGHVVGVALAGRRLLRLDRGALRVAYGRWGATWRSALGNLLAALTSNTGAMSLEGFAVTPSRRNTGVGSAMLARIVDDARRDGVRQIKLTVGASSRARGLYERYGFRVSSVRPVRLGRSRFGDPHLANMCLRLSDTEGGTKMRAPAKRSE